MESWIAGLAQHGYFVLCLVVFLEAIGLPIPAAPALLIAGAASARGSLSLPLALAGAVSAMMSADALLFAMGRYTGWWLLGVLCRLSLNPESCVMRSADSFRRRGRTLLVIAKFIPGINTLSAPMAGSMRMRFPRFLRLDLCGTLLYIGGYLCAGYIGSDLLKTVTRGYQAFGSAVPWVVGISLACYVASRAWLWWRARGWRPVPIVLPRDAARALSNGEAVVYDVRSHGYYERNAVRIRGSRRMDPYMLDSFRKEDVAEGQQVYLYCT